MENFITTGMGDRSRLTLCVFLLGILAFNPFSYFLNIRSDVLPPGYYPQPPGWTVRNILWDADSNGNWRDWIPNSLLAWTLNLTLMLVCLMKLLVYGEAVVKPGSANFTSFWRCKKQADLEISRGNGASGADYLRKSLSCLGRPLPNGRLDRLASVLWQTCRQILQKAFIGRLLSRKLGGMKISQKDRKENIQNLAQVYHQLHQLHLRGHCGENLLEGLSLALNAVNLAEVCEDSFPSDTLVEIYVLAAFRVKECLPQGLLLLARLFLYEAWKLCDSKERPLPPTLCWLFSPLGQDFFYKHKWNFSDSLQDDSIMTHLENPDDPIAFASFKFREFLLEKMMASLAAVNGYSEPAGGKKRHAQLVKETLDLVNQLIEVSNAAGVSWASGASISAHSCFLQPYSHDSVAQWWASLVAANVYWGLGNDAQALKYHQAINIMPHQLHQAQNPLPEAVLLAYRARHCFLSDTASQVECMQLCGAAGKLLKKSLNYALHQDPSFVIQSFQLLSTDLVLRTRSDIWEWSQEKHPVVGQRDGNCPPQPVDFGMLNAFRDDLGCLRKLANQMANIQSRLSLYEATLRIIAGANPTKTQILLDKSLRRRISSPSSIICTKGDLGENVDRDHAEALLLAHRHLPDGVLASGTQREGLLADAAAILDRLGDKRRLRQCQQLMLALGTSQMAV